MQPFVGQILAFGGTFAPSGYMACAGQLLPIAQYDALYALIGTTYGGDGQQTFALPDLRGRVPIHMGQGTGLSVYVIGERSGSESVPLMLNQLPSHGHAVNVVTGQGGNLAKPASNAYLADEFQNPVTVSTYRAYDAANQVSLAGNSVGRIGGSLPHDNMQPYVAITYCIAIAGIFPSRN
jgi:microcystin-dependent protein